MKEQDMNDDLYNQFSADLKLKSYSRRSIKSYTRSVRQLQNFTSKAIEDITEEDVREYWLFCKNELSWGNATLRISYSGIKFFFTHTFKRDWEIFKVVRFERDHTLPVVLNVDEVRLLISAMPNMQHQAFFTLTYGCGLRLHEAINLRVADIDGKRLSIHVHRGKGAKDRYIPVAETVLTVVRDYYRTHRNPVWVFPAHGRDGKAAPTAEQPVSDTTVHGALRRTLQRVGVRKQVCVHTFRHSYATHMIEAGVPVRHVQECLGHKSLASVMVYLHITSHGREDSRRRMEQLMRGVLS
jgi:integrase/recombinase XerD